MIVIFKICYFSYYRQ